MHALIPITQVLAVRELERTDSAGTRTTVKLVVGQPVRYDDQTTGFSGWACSIQIQGLQAPLPSPNVTRVPSPGASAGFRNFTAFGLDGLDALISAIFMARSFLENSAEARAGALRWKESPQAPGFGLPRRVVELTDELRAAIPQMPPAQLDSWKKMLKGLPIAKADMVDRAFEAKDWKDLLRAPVSAIQGVSASDATLLDQAFGIKTIEDLGTNRFFRIAQAIIEAANPPNPIVMPL